jgi:hypothetical protein
MEKVAETSTELVNGEKVTAREYHEILLPILSSAMPPSYFVGSVIE